MDHTSAIIKFEETLSGLHDRIGEILGHLGAHQSDVAEGQDLSPVARDIKEILGRLDAIEKAVSDLARPLPPAMRLTERTSPGPHDGTGPPPPASKMEAILEGLIDQASNPKPDHPQKPKTK